MKKTKILLPCALSMAFILLLAACKKGDTGPAGPAGPAGPTGATGAQGAVGTANVIYSEWLDVTYTADTIHNPDASIDTIGYFASIDAAKLDNTILNSGEVKVYLNANVPDQPYVVPLPFTDLYAFFGVLTINPGFYLNTIFLYADQDASSFTVPSGPSAGLKAWQYRYILIPGGTTARSYKSINWSNYSEVKAYLGLKD